MLVILLASGWARGAAAWLAAVGACAVVMLIAKLAIGFAYGSCGAQAAATHPFSPSGHAALGAVIYGGLAVLGSRHLPELARFVLAIAASAWVGAIAASRVELHAHSSLEVGVGLAVGGAAVALLGAVIGRSSGPRWLLAVLAVATVGMVAMLHGVRWPIEESLHAIAVWLRGSAGLCGR